MRVLRRAIHSQPITPTPLAVLRKRLLGNLIIGIIWIGLVKQLRWAVASETWLQYGIQCVSLMLFFTALDYLGDWLKSLWLKFKPSPKFIHR